jgi:hypothetical protein
MKYAHLGLLIPAFLAAASPAPAQQMTGVEGLYVFEAGMAPHRTKGVSRRGTMMEGPSILPTTVT